MTPERWEQIDQVFQAALEKPLAERGVFLTERCLADDALRCEVESLLSAKAQAGSFLDTPAMEIAARRILDGQSQIVAGQTVGAYQLLSRVGAGGMGEVWRARDTRIDRNVAIKFCHQQVTQRFEQEARAIGALNHPNICQLHDVGPDYLVMELVEGESPVGPMDLGTALHYARQIAEALDAAHEKGIVHRDLKPDNIKIRADGAVKVLDFGVAKLGATPPSSDQAARNADIHATQAGLVLGTAAYMSPEQVRGEQVDKRTDIWAFGVLLYQMLTGEQPFSRATFSETRAAVLAAELDWNRVPAGARRALRRCLEKDPKKRLRDIGDVWELFEENQDAPRGAETGLHRRRWIAVGTVALAAAGALSWIGWRSSVPPGKPLVRLDVDLGAGVFLNLTGGSDPILSPDGARIAYVSQARMFTRRLDEPEAKELSGAQGATSPFFSPDGQWIAFFGNGKLRKISVNGGEAIDICRSSAAFTGGSWGEDNTIVAALSATGPLSRIPSAGGNAQTITELDASSREASHRLPQILPGGQAVIFTAHTSIAGFDDAKVDVIDLRNQRRKTLIRGGTFGRYLPSGHLIYVSRGSLFAVPFDTKRLEVRGKAAAVLDEVIYSPRFGSASVAFSRNGTLLYRSGGAGSRMMTVQWLDRQGLTEPLFAKPGMYMDPRLAPDDNRLVVANGEGSDRGLWVHDPQRETSTRLTSADGIFRAPVWTRDGRFIVCRSEGGMSWMRADGSGKPALLTRSQHLQVPGSFSADGSRLAFLHVPFGAGGHSGADLWTVPVESHGTDLRAGAPEPFLQTPFNEHHPSFSNDGRWLAYASDESGVLQVYVRAFPDTGEKWMVSRAGGLQPIFSPAGSELFFLNHASQIMVAHYTVKGKSFEIELPRLWSERRLSDLGVSFGFYDVAPDGKRIAALMLPDDPKQQRAQNHVVYLENFFDELRRRVPVN